MTSPRRDAQEAMEKGRACQEQIWYTNNPSTWTVDEKMVEGSFYCIAKKGHEGPHIIDTLGMVEAIKETEEDEETNAKEASDRRLTA